ncbi:MAG: hypothetical protein ACOY4I_15695 [Bacillota bacterium]
MFESIFFNSNTGRTALFFLAGWLSARILLPGLSGMIAGSGFVKPNYRGERIPLGLGTVFLLGAVVSLTAFFIILTDDLRQKSSLFLLTLSIYTCLGIIDDIWGDGSCRGFSGHLKSLLQGRLTTGCLKALAGGMAALYISLSGFPSYRPWLLAPLDALLIALSVNAINLLDLRPGRAGKSFLILAALIFMAFPQRGEMAFASLISGILLAYLPMDLKARAMMGDSGANALGAVLGITAVWIFDLELKFLYLTALVLLHMLAEKKSLTSLIASSSALDYLDRLGRRER